MLLLQRMMDNYIDKQIQLYYDQKNEWLFSNHLVEITSNDNSTNETR